MMRLITKLSALMAVLVALSMFLMLLGASFNFYQTAYHHTQLRWNAIMTMIDQSLLTSPVERLDEWVPMMMRASGGVQLVLRTETGILYQSLSPSHDSFLGSWNRARTLALPLVQHPGVVLHVSYVDPSAGYRDLISSTPAVSGAIMLIISILLFSLYWLWKQIRGIELLEQRARRILLNEQDHEYRGDMREWPYAVSSALDKLQSELLDAREGRSRVDTLIRAFAALDGQTGLNNRLFFDNQLTTRLEEPGVHGVVMMARLPDFDLLQEVCSASLVKELRYSLVNMLSTFVMRYPGALLARYFNSDFTVLLPHRSLQEAENMAAQLVRLVKSLPLVSSLDRESLIQIGITAYRTGQTQEQIIDCVEQATRNADLQGGNSWYVYDYQVPDVRRGSVRWRTLLELSLSRGGPIVYQKPIVMVEGTVHHREMSPRIFDGDQMLLPTEFMSLVQQLGLSERFDRQMISKVLPMLAIWPTEVLAVEVSIDSLLHHRFQIWLRDSLMQLEKTQRERILFELAEADVCQHTDRLRPVVASLHALGCRWVVMHAGLTVVSTSYIKRLKIEWVKLHPGLVRNIEKRMENQLFLRSLVDACDGTAAQVFAVGVRTREEWTCLCDNGIRGGQGEFFAPAEPVDSNKKKYSQHYRV